MILSAVLVSACGRAGLRQGQPDAARGVLPDVPSVDVPVDARPELSSRDGPMEAPVLADASDLAAVDIAPARSGCGDLAHLADQGLLTKQRTSQVVFAPDRSWLVLKVRQDAPPDAGYPDQLLRVALPSGEVTTISSDGATAEALGPNGLLVVASNGGLAVHENGGLRSLASSSCAHLSSPDGSRVYVIRDCGSSIRGALDVIEVASGTPTTLASNVLDETYWTPDFAVSPSGKYFVFFNLQDGKSYLRRSGAKF